MTLEITIELQEVQALEQREELAALTMMVSFQMSKYLVDVFGKSLPVGKDFFYAIFLFVDLVLQRILPANFS